MIHSTLVFLQSTDAAGYRLRRRDPDGCDPDDCDYFLGVDTNSGNSSYLDFYLVGEATGWVAVGFSPTANMVSGHSLPCWAVCVRVSISCITVSLSLFPTLSRPLPPLQLDADVLGCSVDRNGDNPLVIDTYNPGSRTNLQDTSSTQAPVS